MLATLIVICTPLINAGICITLTIKRLGQINPVFKVLVNSKFEILTYIHIDKWSCINTFDIYNLVLYMWFIYFMEFNCNTINSALLCSLPNLSILKSYNYNKMLF